MLCSSSSSKEIYDEQSNGNDVPAWVCLCGLFCPVAYLYSPTLGTAGDMLCHFASGPTPPGTRWAPESGGFQADEALGAQETAEVRGRGREWQGEREGGSWVESAGQKRCTRACFSLRGNCGAVGTLEEFGRICAENAAANPEVGGLVQTRAQSMASPAVHV